MNWKQKVAAVRNVFAANVAFSGRNADAFREDFLFTLRETDTFHPFDNDCALTHNDEDDLYNMFAEMEDKVQEHYDNPWNHAPGYKAPEGITIDISKCVDEYLATAEA